MSDYARTILRDLGLAIHVPGAMAVVSIAVCLIAGEAYAIPGFAICAVVSLGIGQGLFRAFRDAMVMQVRHAMDTAVLAWITISVLGTLPFLVTAYWVADGAAATPSLLAFRDPWNALFESVSGFTTTGLTVTARPEDLPHALVWWRSFSQWMGGVGVIVVMLAVFHPEQYGLRLFFAEAREKTIMPDVFETVRTIWWIYLLFTALAIVALGLAGMGWWHALNYGLAGIATGGFGASNGGIADFGTLPRVVLMAVFVMGSISFATHYRILAKGQVSVLWRDGETRLLFALIVAGAGLLALENWWFTGRAQLFDSLFHWASALCTAGFQSVNPGEWSPTAQLLLVAGMIMGGAAGSSAGGLKLYRVALLAQGAITRIGRMVRQPWRLFEHEALGDDEEALRRRHALEAASLLALLWIMALFGGTVLLSHVVGPDFPVVSVLLETASALSVVGLTTGITGPELPAAGKAVLIVLMWMGRLEIVPVLVLLASLRPRRASRGS